MRIQSFLVLTFLAFSATARAEEIKVFTNATSNPMPKTDNAGSFIGKADTCVHVDLNGKQPSAYGNATTNCTISVKDPNNAAVNLSTAGKGEIGEPKYDNNQPRNFRSFGVLQDAGNTLGNAGAQFTTKAPVLDAAGKRTFPITLRANGTIEAIDKTKAITSTGLAAANVKDPQEFTFTTSGVFEYDLLFGEQSVDLDPNTGDPLPNLSFFNNSDLGRNYFEYSAALEGVSYNGKPLHGDFFSIFINAYGPILTLDDLIVHFIPSDILGLSDFAIDTMNLYIRSQFHLLSGGAFGLDPGQSFWIFGGTSPIGTLKFDYQPGTVIYNDSLIAAASVVPEPSTWVFLAAGMIGMLGYRIPK